MLAELQTTPASKSNDTCVSDSQFSYCGVNVIPKQRMCDSIKPSMTTAVTERFSYIVYNILKNHNLTVLKQMPFLWQDEFVQLCGIDERREKNVSVPTLKSHTIASAGQDTDLSGSSTVKVSCLDCHCYSTMSHPCKPDPPWLSLTYHPYRYIIHTRFPNPVYHNTRDIEEDAISILIHLLF
ncbi:hypothetical protein E2C01_068762 [Portunus trituberculatus]|uniref:Uncharacterized protein n=1 Tax=Portunus trituberculatus TaxID=210409 RepID=A0A5B7I0Z9_PORTR|nr:hypothetical protein [Portunus trituberculatus]